LLYLINASHNTGQDVLTFAWAISASSSHANSQQLSSADLLHLTGRWFETNMNLHTQHNKVLGAKLLMTQHIRFVHADYLLFPFRPSWLSIEFREGFLLLSPKDKGPPEIKMHPMRSLNDAVNNSTCRSQSA
jgi:hypothetical protein